MNIRTIGIWIVAIALILAISMTASAEPAAVDTPSTDVTGGVVSSMDLNTISQTYNWAGYYGEITGTLELASGTNTMYSWIADDIGGEVYASTASSITWSNISAESAADVDANLSYLSDKSDSATITFDDTNSAIISVGTVPISSGVASATHMYVNGLAQTADFEEVILTDGTNTVWTAIISPNKDGFESDSTTHDYQMIVPEDGSGNTNAETYYFYVELT